jgi:soluble lytic murein transglycosylase
MQKKFKLIIAFTIILVILLAGAFLYPMVEEKVLKTIYPIKYEEIVNKYAAQYSVEPAMIYAVIKTESNFKSEAKSNKDAFGLMQITKETLWWLITKTPENDSETEFEHLAEPETNIRYGTLLLKLNFETYHDEGTAICAYNAGRGRVDRWLVDSRYSADGNKLDHIPYTESKNFVKKVLKAREFYKKLYFSGDEK